MTNGTIARAADGYYHPVSEDEVVALVRHAAAGGLKLRVRGATHSVAWSIFTDPVDGVPANRTLQAVPPAGPNLDLALDQIAGFDWIDADAGIVEVGAGIHMGHDPDDPFGGSTLANSLLYQAFERGWALDIVGGITHQTIAGFTGTGSAGGSVQYGLDNVLAFRVVDGRGDVAWIARGDVAFDAMLTACGLLGVVTAMRLQLVPMYTITGEELITLPTGDTCPVDLFGPGGATTPSLARFLTDTPYSRITWWPQPGCERVQIWSAARTPVDTAVALVPYREFTPDLAGEIKQLLAAVFFVLLGNDGVDVVQPLIAAKVARFESNLARMWAPTMPGEGALLAAAAVAGLARIILYLPVLVLAGKPGSMKQLFPTLLPVFNPMSGAAPTRFHDYYWRSLCMDNTADDVLLGTEFLEIWLPIGRAAQVMTLFAAMFATGGSAATGYYAQEIYAAKPSSGWINPGYSDGSDEYKDGAVRFDVYWYRDNTGTPNDIHGFFKQYWDLLLANGIPFRFHWGKFIPLYDFAFWAAHYRASLPRFDDFLALRAARDPHDVFFTGYWQLRLTGTST